MRRLAWKAERCAISHLMIKLVVDEVLRGSWEGRCVRDRCGECSVIFRVWGKRKASMASARGIFKASVLRTGR